MSNSSPSNKAAKTATGKAADQTADSGQAAKSKFTRFASIAAGSVVAVALAIAVLPRWWAQQIGDAVDGGLLRGTFIGIAVGFTFAILPIALLFYGLSRSSARRTKVVVLIVAALLATPNLATLWIVLGISGSAKAGQEIFDVEAPGFRLGTFLGVAGAIVVAVLAYMNLKKSKENKSVDEAGDKKAQTTPPAATPAVSDASEVNVSAPTSLEQASKRPETSI